MMNIHDFFYFLGLDIGNFIKTFVELLFFVLVTYMVISEHTREHTRELRYLIMAFGILALEKFISAFYLFGTIYSDLPFEILRYAIPVAGNSLEIVGLILLASAFIYPYYNGDLKSLRSAIKYSVIFFVIIALIVQAFWVVKLLGSPNIGFRNFSGSVVFILIKIIVLAYPIAYLSFFTKAEFGNIRNLVIAYAAYLIVPILQFTNFIFFGNTSNQIFVAQHPFPLISVLLFTRVVYLKLVDKATLKDKLKLSEEKYKEEKELSKLKDEFVSVVSHELRTPITSMKLYTDLLEKGKFGKLNKKQKKSIGVIKDETNRLVTLVNDVLDLTKLEAGGSRLNIKNFEFGKYCRDNIYYPLARQKGIKVVNKVKENFTLQVDPDKFRQVFVNLFTNAMKYTPNGTITISASSLKDRWNVSIKDTGIGIEKSEVPRLFDKFYIVEDLMTRKERGIGLGLAIVKKIVDLHNGNIEVKSQLGKGSEFVVSIPKF